MRSRLAMVLIPLFLLLSGTANAKPSGCSLMDLFRRLLGGQLREDPPPVDQAEVAKALDVMTPIQMTAAARHSDQYSNPPVYNGMDTAAIEAQALNNVPGQNFTPDQVFNRTFQVVPGPDGTPYRLNGTKLKVDKGYIWVITVDGRLLVSPIPCVPQGIFRGKLFKHSSFADVIRAGGQIGGTELDESTGHFGPNQESGTVFKAIAFLEASGFKKGYFKGKAYNKMQQGG